jgi:hypothetical protein
MIRRLVSHEWVREGFSTIVVEFTPLDAASTIYVTVTGKSPMTCPQLLGFSLSKYPDQLWVLAVDAVEMRGPRPEVVVSLQVPAGYCFVKVDLVGRLVPSHVPGGAFTAVELPDLRHDVTIAIEGRRPANVAAEALCFCPPSAHPPIAVEAGQLSPQRDAVSASAGGSRSRPRTRVSEARSSPEVSTCVTNRAATVTGPGGFGAGFDEPGGCGTNLTSILMDPDNFHDAYGPSYQLLGLRREVVEKEVQLKELLAAEEQEKELIAVGRMKASLWSQEKTALLARLRPNLKTPSL